MKVEAVALTSITLDPANARKHGERPNRRKGTDETCAQCGASYYRHACTPDRRACSVACGNASRQRYERSERSCKTCAKLFVHIPKPHSNSAGTYCSIECRNTGYAAEATHYGVKGHRTRWRARRNRFINAGNDFCARCGERGGRLEVHHVEPYRLSRNDDPANLVTLCHPCHAKLEPLSSQVEALPAHKRGIAVAIIQAHLQDSWLLHKGGHA